MSQVQYPLRKRHLQFIKQTTKLVPCQSQTENHVSHLSITTDQSKQFHSSSNQISGASVDQITNWPSPQGTNISPEKPRKTQSEKSTQKTNLSPEKNSYQTRFDLTTHNLYFMIQVEVFTSHILAENAYFMNHREWADHKNEFLKPASKCQIIWQHISSIILMADFQHPLFLCWAKVLWT